jgi:hypothetical protein
VAREAQEAVREYKTSKDLTTVSSENTVSSGRPLKMPSIPETSDS